LADIDPSVTTRRIGRPRTVLYVAWAPFFSGAERALLRLIEGLDRSRYRPFVVLGTDGELAAELRAQQVEVAHVPVVYAEARRLAAWSASVSRVIWQAWRHGAALIHANDAPSFQPAGYAARSLGLPALAHIRFPDTNAGFRWFLKPGFSRALFVSANLLDGAMSEAQSLFADRSDVVYDGVPTPPVPDEAARQRIRHDLGLPENRAVVVLAGQVAEVKGLWDFIEAAQILVDRGTPVSFAVLGDDLRNKGALRIQAEQAVQARGLAGCFHFLGFRPNAERLIAAFDIVAVPSHVEPLGNSTLEAMAAGRPVVGSRVGGIPEMIVDGVTGTLVPSRDPLKLAAAVEVLVRDPAKARALGLAGRARAIDRFAVPTHAARVESIYDQVIDAPARRWLRRDNSIA
jgi:glycosyltransferase involved in cell wall biosynthesis